MTSNNNLGDYFDRIFTLVVANTPILKQEAYRIRYQVYCQELQYESQENFPNQMEQDEFDERSIHILLKYKPTNTYIGCVRMILADQNQLDKPFPFEKICQHNINFHQQPRNNFFEISRLAVVSQFRRRAGEENTPHGLLYSQEETSQGTQEKRSASLIAMSLYLACTSIAVNLNIDSLTLMEARLQRHLRWYGIPAHSIGNFTEFHGKRGPFLLKRQEVLASLKPETAHLFEKIHPEISKVLLDVSRKMPQKQAIVSSSEFLALFNRTYQLA